MAAATGKDVLVPAPHPPEFRRRAVQLPTSGPNHSPRSPRIWISESCLRNWLAQADVNGGTRPGLSSDERAELIQLRRDNRVQAMEIEILKRASAYVGDRCQEAVSSIR